MELDLEVVLITHRDRITPVFTVAALRDADTHRRLAALVLADTDQMHHAAHIWFSKAARDDFRDREILFNITRHDRIQHIVWRQAVLVLSLIHISAPTRP